MKTRGIICKLLNLKFCMSIKDFCSDVNVGVFRTNHRMKFDEFCPTEIKDGETLTYYI